MEENVALDSSKQKQFVKGIKKLIKKGNYVVPKPDAEVETKDLKKKDKKKSRNERGLVYLSHIPHGFYEHQMTQYFKQFGKVTNARVIRSKKTGNSKGCAFVEFSEPSVAQIVAETMNNYLMGKRLIKASYVPPEKQKRNAMRKRWSSIKNPGLDARNKMQKDFNENKSEESELKKARKLLSNLTKTKNKLKEIGVDYDFFQPVDVPGELKKTETETSGNLIRIQSKKTNKKVAVKVETSDEDEDVESDESSEDEVATPVKGPIRQVKPTKAKKPVKVTKVAGPVTRAAPAVRAAPTQLKNAVTKKKPVPLQKSPQNEKKQKFEKTNKKTTKPLKKKK